MGEFDPHRARSTVRREVGCRVSTVRLSGSRTPPQAPFAPGPVRVVHGWGDRHRAPSPAAEPAASFPVPIRVDAAKSQGELKPIYRFFGGDEPNSTYMKDGKTLRAIGRLGEPQTYFRADSLLVTGVGPPALKPGSTNAEREDVAAKSVYARTIDDRVFDAQLATLGPAPATVAVTGGTSTLAFPLPRHAGSLIILQG